MNNKENQKHTDPENETKSHNQKKTAWLSVFLIIVLGFTVYGNSLHGQFFWDDDFLIKDNEYVKSWTNLPKIFTEDDGAGSGIRYAYYRPLRMVTYMLDYSLWKSDVRGYHLTNILLHILVGLCLYWLTVLLSEDRRLSLLTSIFFIVHPIQSETVACLSYRTDILATLLMLFCFILYIKRIALKAAGPLLLIGLTYLAAILSKESALILPALLLLYHYAFKVKLKYKEFLTIQYRGYNKLLLNDHQFQWLF